MSGDHDMDGSHPLLRDTSRSSVNDHVVTNVINVYEDTPPQGESNNNFDAGDQDRPSLEDGEEEGVRVSLP